MNEQKPNKTYFQKVKNTILPYAFIGACTGFIGGALIQNYRTTDAYLIEIESAPFEEKHVVGSRHQEDLGEKALTGSLIGAGLGAIASGLYAARKK